MILRTLNNFL